LWDDPRLADHRLHQGGTMNFDFGRVLTRSWQIIWKHKVLWIFGILAGCARGNGGGSGGGGNSGYEYQTGPGGQPPFPTDQLEQWFNQATDFLKDNLWIIIAFVLGILLLSLLFYALGMMGRIGLIRGTYKAETGAQSLAFGELWSESLPFFWRIFGMNLLLGLLIFVLIIPFVILAVVTAGAAIICLLPLLCILVPVSWVLMVVLEQAQAAIVIEDLGLMDGVRRGWEVVKSNVGAMIVMALILGIGGVILGFVVALPVIIAMVPIILGAATSSLRESLTPVWISLACCAAYMPLLILLNGLISAYLQAAWTLTFMQVATPKESAPAIVEANA
jgi:hypothetical protein